MAGKNATLSEFHGKAATPPETQQETQKAQPVEATPEILNSDRLAFSEIAQTIFATEGWEQNAVLAGIKQQCEDRIVAIDEALKDV